MVGLSKDELLRQALENGIIDLDTVQEQINMNERKRYLEKHPYHIWKGKDEKWCTYIPDEKKGRLQRKRNSKKEIEDVIVAYWKCEEEKIYFGDVFNEWMHERREFKEVEMSSYARYYTDYYRFFSEDEPFCQIRFQYIQDSDLERFIKKQIREKQLTEKAYSMLRLIIRGTFRFARSRGYTQLSISTFFDDLYIPKNMFQKKKRNDVDEVYSEHEATLLANYFREHPNIINMGLLLQFQTGLRIGELVALDHNHVRGKYIKVANTEETYNDPDTKERVVGIKDTTKTPAGERVVIIPEGAMDTMRRILYLSQDEEYLFSRNGKIITSRVFRYHLNKACKAVEIKYRPPHKARKTYASTLIAHNVNETLVKEMMGHRDILTTHRYYNYNIQSQEQKEYEIDRAITL